jgi:energy-coupling factor transport system permease protein
MPSFLADINPLLKIISTIVLISVTFALRDVWAVGVLVGVLLVLLFSAVRLQLRLLLYGLASLVLFTIFARWLLGNWQEALFNTFRLMAILLPAPILAGTTPPADLLRALQAARLPGFLVLSLTLIWRFLPVIQQEANRILEANQLRGIDLRRQPQQLFSGFFMPLIFQIVSYADEVTIGLETRGYDPATPRSMGKPLIWKMKDTGFAIAATLLIIIVGYLELRG